MLAGFAFEANGFVRVPVIIRTEDVLDWDGRATVLDPGNSGGYVSSIASDGSLFVMVGGSEGITGPASNPARYNLFSSTDLTNWTRDTYVDANAPGATSGMLQRAMVGG